MKGSASAFPDWAHLPLLVLYLISEKLKSIADYIRFRAVCSPWRSASLAKPHHLPFQLPWLMIPHPLDRQDDGIRLFYDLWKNKMHKIHLPETVGKMCCASYRGWLLLVASDRTELFLLNPLTRTRVELPPFTNPIKILGARQDSYYRRCWFESYVDDYGIAKIIFSADLTDPNCLIMVVLHCSQGIYFCKVGDLCWTEAIPHPVRRLAVPHPVGRLLLKDATYNNGSFYLLYDEAMFIYDLNQQRVQVKYFFKPELQRLSKFFLEEKSGIYVVAVHYTKEGVEDEEPPGQKMDLYQVQEQTLKVKQIADTSHITIFNGKFNYYLGVRADDWDSLDGDCMYMTYACWTFAGNDDDGGSYSIFCAKLDDGKPKPVVLGLCEELLTWSPRSATWFQPSFV